MLLNRRGLLLGLGAALAAPAIVHAENLMPVKRIILPPPRKLYRIMSIANFDHHSEFMIGTASGLGGSFRTNPDVGHTLRVGDWVEIT